MDKALQTMIDNMPEKTGKSLEEWTKLLQKRNFAKHGEAMKFLKGEHGVTHGFANTIIQLSKKKNDGPNELLYKQYEGKESLRPIYDKIIEIVDKFGNDITITPKKSSVSLIRKNQFALIKPATKSRVDLGLKIKDKDTEGRLEGSGPFGTMCTHRVKIEDQSGVDKEVINWLKLAYDQSV